MDRTISRRTFVFSSALAFAGCAAAPRRVHRPAPSDKLNVAGIGCGGKGSGDVNACGGENIVALCDVDFDRAAGVFNQYPNARKYHDYRVMLERHPEIDAVTISTPDHTHAPAALMAMRMGKHVFVQKPLTHTVFEARLMAQVARQYGVATQMGNQGHAGEGLRRVCEVIWSGTIGDVHEVHCGTNRPWWPQNVLRPADAQPVPANLDWDCWLGPALWRPYHDGYHPFSWRGWWDFGCGALGDMGCHIMDCVFAALRLGETHPTAVEVVEADGGNDETGPTASIVRYEYPRRGSMPPVHIYWYDGKKSPRVPPELAGETLGDNNANGSVFVGTKGVLTAGEYGGNARLLPEKQWKDFVWPEPWLPRSVGHEKEWLDACKGGPPAGSNFDYAGPLTEMVLLGNVAIRAGGRLEWDGKNLRVTNNPAANRYVSKEYRLGWEIV